MEYKPLNASKNELRLLYPIARLKKSILGRALERFPLQQRKKTEKRICLEMRTVSLGDFTLESREFMLSKRTSFYSGPDHMAKILPELLGPPSKFPSDGVNIQWYANSLTKEAAWVKELDFGRWTWGDYVTLSYCWGKESPSKFIEINGAVIPVQENLWEFLNKAYKSSEASEASGLGRVGLWVDALCINQGDPQERSEQVKRMKDIYSQALGCRAWLGKGSRGSNQVMETMLGLGLWSLNSKKESIEFMQANLHNKEFFPTGFWLNFADFVTRPYWQRLWIVQELALSHQNVTVICGSRIVPWSIVVIAIMVIRSSAELIYETNPESFKFTKDDNTSNLSTGMLRICNLFGFGLQDLDGVLESRSRERIVFKTPDLHRVLRISATSKVTNEEDKVYGILGLVEQSVADLVQPEIGEKSITTVLIEFAKAAIVGTSKLNLLAANGDCAKTNGPGDPEVKFPTWVPDLRKSRITWKDLISGVPYEACKRLDMQVSFDQDRLCAQGFVIDKVDGLGFSGPALQDGVNSSVVPPRNNDNPYGFETVRRDALWRTLVANRDKAGKVVQDTYPSPLDIPWNKPTNVKSQYGQLFSDIRAFNCSFTFGGQDFKSYFKQEELNQIEETRTENTLEVNETIERVCKVLWGRRLLTTQKGYIGVASRNAHQGDSICILLGLDMPAILRPNEDGTYAWIGESYIHGIMEGQAIEWLQKGSYALEEIVIA